MPDPITDNPERDQLFLSFVLCGSSEHLYLVYGHYVQAGRFTMIELEVPRKLVNDFMLIWNAEGYVPTFPGDFLMTSYPKKRFMPGRLLEPNGLEEGELDDEADVNIVERFIFPPTQTVAMLESIGVDTLRKGIEQAIRNTEAASQTKEMDSRAAFDRVERLTQAKGRLEFVVKSSQAQDNRQRSSNALLDKLREIRDGKQPPEAKNI